MKNAILFSLLLCGIFATGIFAAEKPLEIRDAAAFCEREVPNYCRSTTCPQYCNSIRSKNLKNKCLGECTTGKRCSLTPLPNYQDSSDNAVMNAQNRDQLAACIAEKRDPAATQSGRRETPWKELRTPSFVRAVRP